jgi:uncharacterized protein (TIGR03435 family)
MQGGPGTADPGQIMWPNMPLQYLISIAYEHPRYLQVAPDWADKTRYDITAKLPTNTSTPQLHAMLRRLLEDRLALKVHHELRTLPSYDLVVVLSGLRVKPLLSAEIPATPAPLIIKPGEGGLLDAPADATGVWSIPNGSGIVRVAVRNQTMAQIADRLQGHVSAPVADKAGLSGVYRFNIDCLMEGSTPKESSPIQDDLFGALQRQAGLKLEKTTTMQDVLIVDSVLKEPIEK